MNLVYDIKDKPRFGQLLLFSLQQLLAIMAATIAVPSVINSTCGTAMTAAAALFGAGMGSIVYLLFTKSSSPVFLGSSFAFIGSMMSAFSGAASMAAGYWGLILGTVMAGLVYVILAIAVKCSGVGWINKLMPPVIIGPTVAIIGLSLSTNAVADLMNPTVEGGSVYVALICGLITLSVTMLASTYGKKMMKLIPFIVGILAGYVAASIFAFIGRATGSAALIVIDYSAFSTMKGLISAPGFTFLMGSGDGITGTYILTLFAAYVPVAFVVSFLTVSAAFAALVFTSSEVFFTALSIFSALLESDAPASAAAFLIFSCTGGVFRMRTSASSARPSVLRSSSLTRTCPSRTMVSAISVVVTVFLVASLMRST